MKYPDLLLGIQPDGSRYGVVNEYDQIRAFIGNVIEFMHRGDGDHAVALIMDEEALLRPHLDFNMTASLIMQYPIYGPVILCGSKPDRDGDTMPPTRRQRVFAETMAEIVAALHYNADVVGQDLTLHPNPDRVPPPTVTMIPNSDDFFSWLEGEL